MEMKRGNREGKQKERNENHLLKWVSNLNGFHDSISFFHKIWMSAGRKGWKETILLESLEEEQKQDWQRRLKQWDEEKASRRKSSLKQIERETHQSWFHAKRNHWPLQIFAKLVLRNYRWHHQVLIALFWKWFLFQIGFRSNSLYPKRFEELKPPKDE